MAPNPKVSFIAKVELIELRPEHSWTKTTLGWTPPNTSGAFSRGGQQRLFRWHDGNMESFDGQCPETTQRHPAATIFSQGKSRALLAAMCDVRVQDVTEAYGWRPLGFEAAPAPPTLSQVGTQFKNETLRSPGGQAWVGQLLPSCNHCQGLTNKPAITGLTGELPILIALAALSTSEAQINHVLSTSIKEYRWKPHQNGQEPLRDSNKKGIVVTIYYDTNSPGSTKGSLKQLEEGKLDGFYRT